MPLVKKENVTLPKMPLGHATFSTTLWSVVLAVGQEDSTAAAAALEHLCRTYWNPLYGYLRRRGYSDHDAKDHIQGFFEVLLSRQSLQNMKRGEGKFRSYLLTALNRYLISAHHRAHAQKRGGDKTILSLDTEAEEQRYRLELHDSITPQTFYERRWAVTVINQALQRVAKQYQESAKSNLFEHLRAFIVAGAEPRPYPQLAQELGLSEVAVRKAVQRLRRHYRQAIHDEIAQTVATTSEIDEELRYLLSVLSS